MMSNTPETRITNDESSESGSDTATVRVENFTKNYGDVTAVEGISFEVNEGEFFSLVGPSGCGKTTTLRTIAGFQHPTSGSIHLKGEDVTGTSPSARDTAMVFQGYALFPHKSVGENVGFGLKMENVPKSEREKRVSEMLELVDLGGYEDRSPDALSGGQQQRVALARALIMEPSLLLLDEPLSNLDLKLRKKMRVELKQIQKELGITTIYVTHDQEEALSMSDRVLVMNEGRGEQIAPPSEIYNRPRNRFVADFIGDSNFLSGTVEDTSNGMVNVELASDDIVSVAEGRVVPNSITPGDQVQITLRPEEIDVVPTPDSENNITGTISTMIFLGKTTQFHIDAGANGDLVVEMSGLQGQRSLTEGDAVDLTWSPDNALIIE